MSTEFLNVLHLVDKNQMLFLARSTRLILSKTSIVGFAWGSFHVLEQEEELSLVQHDDIRRRWGQKRTTPMNASGGVIDA